MWIKLWSTCLLVALVNAGEYLYDANPYAHYGGYATAYDNYKPTDYKFEYGVSDPHTGDHKSQWEVKENGVVRGAYSLLEADGTTRLVEYYADDTGFHADVKKLGTAIHDAPHYGQLHPLAETHVANSLAYNGYGHGGVTHSYGAPIAAVAKIAAPYPHEIHAAPIAQVQHIAPIPQVIAPQIHHLGTPSQYEYSHDIVPQIYSAPEGHQHYAQHNIHAPVPVLQHPQPFKIQEEVHYAPALKVATPHLVHQHQQYAAPQIVKEYAPEQHYVEPQIIAKHYAEPQQFVAKHYVEPQQIVTKHYAEPQIVAGPGPEYAYAQAEPEYLAKNYAVPTAPEYLENHYVQPEIISKAYAVPDPYYAPPVATAKVAVAAKVQNPFARFFAPLAKYFAVPKAHVAPIPTKVVPTQYYAEAPTKLNIGDFNAYQGYKPEVVIASPHNYAPSPAYGYNHGY